MKRKSKRTAAWLLLTILLFTILLAGCAPQSKRPEQEITKLADLAGKKAASLTGSAFAQKLDLIVSGVEHQYMNDLPSQLDAVESGKASACLLDEPVAQLAVAQRPGLAILQEKLLNDSYGFAMRKGDPLAEKVSDIIRRFEADGTLAKLQDKWFSTDETLKTMPELTYKSDFDGSAGLLRYGCDTTTVPMSYIGENGKYYGFDIELAMKIAYELNMRFEPASMDFSSLIVSLNSGKSDMAGGCMSITEERKESVDFSAPYYRGGMVAVIKKSADTAAEEAITSLEQLAGKKIGILTGSVYASYIIEPFSTAEPVYFNNLSDQIEALKAGKISAILFDEPGLKDAAKSAPGLAILDESLGSVEFGMAAAKGNTALIEKANAEITALKNSGELALLEEKWFGEDETKKQLPDMALPAENGVLRVVTSSIVPPNCYMKDNQLVGYDVELAMRIAQSMGMGIEITDMDFAALIPAVTGGKADLAAGQITITEERKKSVLFSVPCSFSRMRVLVRAAPRADLPVPLETARVGVLTGSIGEIFMSQQYPDAKISSFEGYSDAVAALSGGKLDYVTGSYTSILNYAKKNPSLVVLPDKMNDDANAIALKKGNTELRDKIDAVLDRLRADGTLAEMESRWLKTDDSPYQLADIPKHETGGILRVAISADREPICFVQDGQYVGFDCELTERIAYELGMQTEYQNMKFAGLIASLQAGKADMAISNLTRTEERAKSVEFTQTYFDNPQKLLSRKGSEAVKAPWYQSFAESFEKTFITENRYQLILQGLGITLLISVSSAVLGTLLGFAVCMMRRAKPRWLYLPAKLFVGVIQGTPIVVMLMILFYLIFGSVDVSPVLVAVIGFSINFAAYVSEMMRTGIDAVDKGQLEAAGAIGFNKAQVFCKITMPQALRHVLPVFKGEFISMIKMTSVVGYIAIQDLTKMSDIIRSRTYEAFFPLIATALIYLAISYLVVFLISRIEFHVDPKHRKRIVKGMANR